MLYVVGVLAKSYVDTPFGISISFNTRNGPFFSTILFVAGYFLSGLKPNKTWLMYGFLIFITGTFCHFYEINILTKSYGIQPRQDFVFGTLLMGIGAAITSLSNHSCLQSELLSKAGKMTLGIYASHFIFVGLFSGIDKSTDTVFWEIGQVFIVLLLSILVSLLLSRYQLTKRFVV